MLRPGGTLVVVDKNVWSWNARRPWLPSAAVKWIDERRGTLDVFASRQGARTLVQGRGAADGGSAGGLRTVRVEYLLSPRRARPVSVSAVARRRGCSCSGPRRRREATRDGTLFAMLASLPLLLWKTPPGLELILAQEGVAFETVKRRASVCVSRRAVCPVRRPRGLAGLARGLVGPDHVAIDIDGLQARRADRPVSRP